MKFTLGVQAMGISFPASDRSLARGRSAKAWLSAREQVTLLLKAFLKPLLVESSCCKWKDQLTSWLFTMCIVFLSPSFIFFLQTSCYVSYHIIFNCERHPSPYLSELTETATLSLINIRAEKFGLELHCPPVASGQSATSLRQYKSYSSFCNAQSDDDNGVIIMVGRNRISAQFAPNSWITQASTLSSLFFPSRSQ